MQLADYEKLRYFKAHEFDDPEMMSFNFLCRLDAFRHEVGLGMYLTSTTRGKHKDNSDHYKGLAVDLICPKFKGSILGLYLISERFNFTAIGVYPDWFFDSKVCGGLHLAGPVVQNFRGKRWMGLTEFDYKAKKQKRVYKPLSMSTIIKERLIK